jgi:hypothetical protein
MVCILASVEVIKMETRMFKKLSMFGLVCGTVWAAGVARAQAPAPFGPTPQLIAAATKEKEAKVGGFCFHRCSRFRKNRDYLVTLADGQTLRVITPVHVFVVEGKTVWLHFPPEHFRALAR